MKNDFLKFISLCFFAVNGITFQQLKAEVIVRDANPQYIYSGESFFLDINNNGVNDYELAVTYYGGTSMTPSYSIIDITGLNNDNEIETDGNGKAIALNDGAPVGNNSFENSATIIQTNLSGFYFQENASKFLGLRFKINGNTHFGYFKIEPKSDGWSYLAMYQYGHETIPGQPIMAGAQPATGINDLLAAGDYSIIINDANLEVILAGNTLIDRLELLDISGRAIRSNILHQSAIDISGLPAQVYYLAIYDNHAARPMAVRKVMIGE